MKQSSTQVEHTHHQSYMTGVQKRFSSWFYGSATSPSAKDPLTSPRFRFTVKRSEWERGTEQGFLFQRTQEGACRCCGLGFACRALGLAEEQLDHVRQVDALVSHHVIEPRALGPLQFLFDVKHARSKVNTSLAASESQESVRQTLDAIRIMALNDRKVGKLYGDECDRDLFGLPTIRSESHREKLLTAEFRKHNIEISFVD